MSHRHATDVTSLVFGLIFAGVAIVWLLATNEAINVDQLWLAGPGILIGAGTVGLLAAFRAKR